MLIGSPDAQQLSGDTNWVQNYEKSVSAIAKNKPSDQATYNL